ncbi:UrcA family protein [Sphingomonas sabuli]|uniref:UrcA family protein n=1 Tax=Sphingomonas sabuli TaxID=2764186 RepID=A0A7G9L4V4_9SPHN|nr:UrcA family protein [Sphingomonas sabuli]QNM83653.1 UrcA family protein [Sphingomonas sabuli]
MKQTLKIILASALVTGVAIKAEQAFAQESSSVAVVRTADIDLGSPEGRDRLRQRLTVAAHTLCDDASAADLKARNVTGACRAQVVASGLARAEQLAQRGTGQPLLLALGN